MTPLLEKEVKIYATAEGRFPFEEWIASLRNREVRAIIYARIARVRVGNMGDAQSVGKGVYELRIHVGPGYRVYFGQEGGETVLLLCGGHKSSQERDIKRAQIYWADYRSQS